MGVSRVYRISQDLHRFALTDTSSQPRCIVIHASGLQGPDTAYQKTVSFPPTTLKQYSENIKHTGPWYKGVYRYAVESFSLHR